MAAEKMPSISPARGSLAGSSLALALDELGGEGSLSSEARERVFRVFETCFSEELEALPHFWRLKIRGRLSSYNLGEHEGVIDVSQASVHAQVAAFHNVKRIRISGLLADGALEKKRQRKKETAG
ncbi:unnamed protein product [Polarella glacialis]|uniref:Uncharacterized protein n=1 Tax=Polarella glacialis TaxID=89957 RepID=A0A813H024_POLGL|nr:unnamed protein product [Polarella glacialis]